MSQSRDLEPIVTPTRALSSEQKVRTYSRICLLPFLPGRLKRIHSRWIEQSAGTQRATKKVLPGKEIQGIEMTLSSEQLHALTSFMSTARGLSFVTSLTETGIEAGATLALNIGGMAINIPVDAILAVAAGFGETLLLETAATVSDVPHEKASFARMIGITSVNMLPAISMNAFNGPQRRVIDSGSLFIPDSQLFPEDRIPRAIQSQMHLLQEGES